jgi:hypothetical protein
MSDLAALEPIMSWPVQPHSKNAAKFSFKIPQHILHFLRWNLKHLEKAEVSCGHP